MSDCVTACAHRDGLEIRHAEAAAEGVVFAAVELQQVGPHVAHDLAHFVRRVIHEQRHRVQPSAQCFRMSAAARGDAEPARTALGEYQADRVDAELGTATPMSPRPGHAAELDRGCGQRGDAHSVTSAGRPHSAG